MSDSEKPQTEPGTETKEKEPTLGDKAKKVLKDEAVRTATWEGRSLLHRIFGYRIGRIIRQIFGQ